MRPGLQRLGGKWAILLVFDQKSASTWVSAFPVQSYSVPYAEGPFQEKALWEKENNSSPNPRAFQIVSGFKSGKQRTVSPDVPNERNTFSEQY